MLNTKICTERGISRSAPSMTSPCRYRWWWSGRHGDWCHRHCCCWTRKRRRPCSHHLHCRCRCHSWNRCWSHRRNGWQCWAWPAKGARELSWALCREKQLHLLGWRDWYRPSACVHWVQWSQTQVHSWARSGASCTSHWSHPRSCSGALDCRGRPAGRRSAAGCDCERQAQRLERATEHDEHHQMRISRKEKPRRKAV